MLRRFYVLLAITIPVPAGALAQRDFADVQIKTTHVAGNVYMLEGRGGNIGVSAGPDGLLMIDDQFEPLAPKIRAALEELAGQSRDRKGAARRLRFVLNTHWHGDHVGGNPVFGREATIVAHDNVRKRVSRTQTMRMGGRERTVEALPEAGWPVVTFDESLSIHFNGEEIKVMHLPHGHTDGDSVIYFTESNVLHMGDDFFAGVFPFVDLSSGGDVEGLTRNVAHVIEKVPADVKIIPGHGALSTLDDLKAFHRMLTETTGHVRERMNAGKSLEEIQAEGLPGKWDSWSGSFIPENRWIETVYRSLSERSAAIP